MAKQNDFYFQIDILLLPMNQLLDLPNITFLVVLEEDVGKL